MGHHRAGRTAMLALGLVAAAPPTRVHTATSARPLELLPATQTVSGSPELAIEVQGEWRIISSNGLPGHAVGRFPNRGNPHPIEARAVRYRVPAAPKRAAEPTELGLGVFGVARNGVPFDPGAAEWFRGERDSPWRYEALGGAVPLGIDANHAHVQPTGQYHYHGLPSGLLEEVDDGTAHGPLVGWAADGFPIYALRGHADPMDPASGVASVRSGWALKQGARPAEVEGPGGRYDGTFVADYSYVAEEGVLDACNGRFGVTPEFPDGTYAYFLTAEFPVIPRCFVGTPSPDFRRRPHPPGGGPRGKRPPPRRR